MTDMTEQVIKHWEYLICTRVQIERHISAHLTTLKHYEGLRLEAIHEKQDHDMFVRDTSAYAYALARTYENLRFLEAQISTYRNTFGPIIDQYEREQEGTDADV